MFDSPQELRRIGNAVRYVEHSNPPSNGGGSTVQRKALEWILVKIGTPVGYKYPFKQQDRLKNGGTRDTKKGVTGTTSKNYAMAVDKGASTPPNSLAWARRSYLADDTDNSPNPPMMIWEFIPAVVDIVYFHVIRLPEEVTISAPAYWYGAQGGSQKRSSYCIAYRLDDPTQEEVLVRLLYPTDSGYPISAQLAAGCGWAYEQRWRGNNPVPVTSSSSSSSTSGTSSSSSSSANPIDDPEKSNQIYWQQCTQNPPGPNVQLVAEMDAEPGNPTYTVKTWNGTTLMTGVTMNFTRMFGPTAGAVVEAATTATGTFQNENLFISAANEHYGIIEVCDAAYSGD